MEQGRVAALGHALGDRNTLIRRRAAQALGELAHPDGVSALAIALHRDKDQYVIRWTVETLQHIGNDKAVEALAAAAFSERRDAAALASQALAAIHSPQAEAAFHIREMLQRNTFEGFDTLGEESRSALLAVMNSPQFNAWPSGKRKPVLLAAARLGLAPPAKYRRDLIDMGLFVSGLHTVGDLLAGLSHPNPLTRAAAADKLGETGLRWTGIALRQRFRQETRPGGERSVAVASARALARLGDARGIRHYQQQLAGGDMRQASEAALALGEIGSPQAILVLFETASAPPVPGVVHNDTPILDALASVGPGAVDALRGFAQSDNPRARRLFIELAGRSGHADKWLILRQGCLDPDPDTQRVALDALARLNTPEAARTLFDLKGELSASLLALSLAQMTHAEALAYLRELEPDVTIVHGVVLGDSGAPLIGAHAQIVEERLLDNSQGRGLAAISARAETSAQGEFWLAILDHAGNPATRLKITTSPHGDGVPGETFMAEIELTRGEAHTAKARIDRFVSRLTLNVKTIPQPE